MTWHRGDDRRRHRHPACSSTEVRFQGPRARDRRRGAAVRRRAQGAPLEGDADGRRLLTMSATPIPRTLEMAVTGIREMSTIQTAGGAPPVLTYVGPVRRQAGRRRDPVASCCATARSSSCTTASSRSTASRTNARQIARARIQTARADERAPLEQVIVDFWEKGSTSSSRRRIVESGLDIPNANTLILDRADVFRASQLPAARARRPQPRRRYAYFLYPPEKPLTETAHDRLQTSRPTPTSARAWRSR